MKVRVIRTGEVINAIPRYDPFGNLIGYSGNVNTYSLNEVETIEENTRLQVAKDILCAIVSGGYDRQRIDRQVEIALMYADALIEKSK